MALRNVLVACALALGVSTSVLAAAVTYSGDLLPNAPRTGDAGGFSWFLDDGGGVDYWRFHADAGAKITLRVDRLSANLDPALSVYFGTTAADTSLFDSVGDWGGLVYVTTFDDENPAAMDPGPFGDPFGTFVATATGFYTVVVGGNGSTDAQAYPYRIALAVPEPPSGALAALAIGAIAFARRRKTR